MDYLEYKNYVSHSGILGMKWGKRNGPPYPLKPGDHSAEEKRKNKGNYSQDNRPKNPNASGKSTSSDIQKVPDDVYSGKKKMSPETKKKILIGAGITAGVIAVTGATTLGVAVAVKEPEVFGNALDSLKNVTIDRFSKGGKDIRDYADNVSEGMGKKDSKELKKAILNTYNEGLNDKRRAERDDQRAYKELLSKDKYLRKNGIVDPDITAELIGRERDKIEANRTTKDAKIIDNTMRNKQKEIKRDVKTGINEQNARKAKANYEKAASNVKYVWNKADQATKKASDFTNKATSPARNATQAVKNVTGTIAGVSGTVAVTKKMYDNIQAKSLGMTPQEYQQYKKYINQQR